MNFKDILIPIEKELSDFDSFYKKRLKTKVSLLSTIINYGTKSKGKQLRPSLVFLSAMLFGEKVSERQFNGAVLSEMLHNATLVHDDVVDEADERRGIKSINALWNNKIAVLVGDYYLAQGLLTAIDNDEFEYLKILSNSVKRMSEGELLSLEKSKDVLMTEEIYFEICSNKTASLLSSCCEIGAVSANATSEEREQLALFGEKIGVAFQLKDDVFDYTSSNTIIGKPTGNDIKEKKITLPLIYALSNAEDTKRKEIIKILKKKKLTKKEIQYVVDFAVENGGIEYTQNIAENYINDAKKLIADFDDCAAKKSLLALADFIINRRN